MVVGEGVVSSGLASFVGWDLTSGKEATPLLLGDDCFLLSGINGDTL